MENQKKLKSTADALSDLAEKAQRFTAAFASIANMTLGIKLDGLINEKEEMVMKLGDRVMDSYSGFKGIAVARHSYLNGCDRYTVQPPVGEDMKLPDAETFDEMQLVLVEPKEEKRDTDTGGPEKFSDRRRY